MIYTRASPMYTHSVRAVPGPLILNAAKRCIRRSRLYICMHVCCCASFIIIVIIICFWGEGGCRIMPHTLPVGGVLKEPHFNINCYSLQVLDGTLSAVRLWEMSDNNHAISTSGFSVTKSQIVCIPPYHCSICNLIITHKHTQ